jgi:hypothetical protein
MTALVHAKADAARAIQLFGWDSRTGTWSGPTGLGPAGRTSKRLLNTLRTMPGNAWYGTLRCASAGEPSARFFVVVHDLKDCAVAMVYCGESKAGPAEVLAVIPAQLRHRLRPEFAFEFLAFASFLGAVSESAAVSLHERITAAIGESAPEDSLVFSLCTGLWPSDRDAELSQCIENIARSVLPWLAERTP